MKKIESFTIDHTRLKRGIYVSRQDQVGGSVVTTFDLRMKEPNNEPAISSAAAHTIEHIGATFLRNHSAYGNSIVYFGPMGCLTGFYLLVSGNTDSREIAPLIQELFKYIKEFEGAVPGATAVECGNYTLMDLPDALIEAQKYYSEVLDGIVDAHLEYPE